MAITDAWLRANSGKPYNGKPEITYRDGLGIRISPKGKISWIYRVNFFGKPLKMTLGGYPELKIRDALRIRDDKADLVAQGIDPRSGLNLKTKTKPTTIDEAIAYWIENHAMDNVILWQAHQKMFKTDISPYIGAYPVRQLELIDFMPVFKKARERVSAQHAAGLMSKLKSVLSYAVRHGLIKFNPIAELRRTDVGEGTKVRKTRQGKEGVIALWKAIDTVPTHQSNRNLLKLMMIFACRGNELRLSTKSEFDLEKRIWTVPVEHNKNRKKDPSPIVRAIPDLAAEIIAEQMKLWPDFKVMFPSVGFGRDQVMHQSSVVKIGTKLANTIQALGYPRTTNHDMRRNARNIWEERKVPYKVSEVMLGHKVHTGIDAHYLDYKYPNEQREAYEMWCQIITEEVE
ncbi:tyrosine-type recombinase/integrase [Vibrio sp. MEBiC08052]|uniref:tyrosine-type recombinase/integrase n=1 Tax=Vibrio sp. MEBiC08052 TaxID=1761910 RepID=UPI0007406DBE|nr:site-specific integrase [Vibrio sp. MEBiC08052]KUI98647.1 integrase, putative [Vibrio sp. MEBiC08052]